MDVPADEEGTVAIAKSVEDLVEEFLGGAVVAAHEAHESSGNPDFPRLVQLVLLHPVARGGVLTMLQELIQDGPGLGGGWRQVEGLSGSLRHVSW